MHATAFVLAAAAPVRAALVTSSWVSGRPVLARAVMGRRARVVAMADEPAVSPPDAGAVPGEAAPEAAPEPAAAAPETAAVAPETAPAASETVAAAESVAAPTESIAAPESAAGDDKADKRKRRRPVRARKEVTLLLEDMTVGMELEGTVKSVMDYGAFIGDLGTSTDGLLHVSQLAAGFVQNVTDIVNIGDKVNVRVMGVDMAKGNFSLTMKTAEDMASAEKSGERRGSGSSSGGGGRREDPETAQKWNDFKFDPTKYLSAKVMSVTDFGGFCQLVNEEGNPLDSVPTDGLIHISELSSERVSKVSDILSVGQTVKVRVTSTDRKRNRISMSMKEYNPDDASNQNIAEDLAAAAAGQPVFKTSMELAFERFNASAKS